MTAARRFAQQFADRNLHNLYENHISLTSAIGIDRLNRNAFEQRLSAEIAIISKKVKTGSYKFSQYKEKLISKGASKHPQSNLNSHVSRPDHVACAVQRFEENI